MSARRKKLSGRGLKDLQAFAKTQMSDAYLADIDKELVKMTPRQRANLAIGPDADTSAYLSGRDGDYLDAIIKHETKTWKAENPGKPTDYDAISFNVIEWLVS
jgi:hypothetical protein